MKLSKAFEMTVSYTGIEQQIRVDKDERMCLNDMAKFFPNKTLDNWLRTKQTKEFIIVLERFLKPSGVTELKLDDFGSRGAIPKGLESIKTKSGRYGGGTYAEKTLALKFAMWLSPEFELNVLLAYQQGTQQKENWNIKRILASENYKLQCESVKNSEEGKLPRGLGYSNNGKLINLIVFGKHEKDRRKSATEEELAQISYLESKNSAYLDLGLSYENRKVILKQLFDKKYKTTNYLEDLND